MLIMPGCAPAPGSQWEWRHFSQPFEIVNFLNGTGDYTHPVKDARVCVAWKDDHAEYYIFYIPGTPGHPAVRWGWKKSTTTDDVKDFLNGKGNYLYPASTARIAAMKKNGTPEFHIFFKRAGIQGEIPNWSEGKESSSPNDVRNFLNGQTPYRQRVKGSDICAVLIGDQTSHNPGKIAIIAKLDILRHQRFSEPLPFTGGKTIYDHLKTYIHTIYLKLSCADAHGGSGTITLPRGASLWGITIDGTVEDPEACKHPVAYELKPYCLLLGGLIHEERHSEPDDPGHVRCLEKTNMDVRLEGGSGHAWGALYWIWMYGYGLYDPPSEKEMARKVLRTVLRFRFCIRPTHSHPRVQAILDEIIDW